MSFAPLVKTMEKYLQKKFMFNKYCQIRKMYSYTGLLQGFWAQLQRNYFVESADFTCL